MNTSLCNMPYRNETYNTTDLTPDKQTYIQRSMGFLIVGCTGIISNLFAIFVLGSSAQIRIKLANTLIIHQSFIDLLASVFSVALTHIEVPDVHGLEGFHAEVHCFFINCKWPLWLMMDVSSFSLIFLNIERYISIVFPIYHHTTVTRKRVLMLLPIVWILGILEQYWVCNCFEAENGSCVLEDPEMYGITVIAFLVVHFFFPLLLVLFLYGHMFVLLRRNSRTGSTSSNRSDLMEKAKNNVFKPMLLITLFYALCYVSSSTYATLITLGILKTFAGEYFFPCKNK